MVDCTVHWLKAELKRMNVDWSRRAVAACRAKRGAQAKNTALRCGTNDSLNQTGQQVVRRNLNIQPTITIRPGFPVRVIVNRDLVLAPYQG
jgi:type IV secretory pathway VirB10-like protein